MIRLALLYSFCALLAVYAWGDWYKALCGLVLLIAVVEHPDMPKSMLGIQGLNPWNALLLIIVLAWARSRGEEGLSWDMPRHVAVLLLSYLAVVLWAFARMMADPDPAFREAFPVSYLVSEYLVNCLKWVVPGLLIFDGCRSRSRFTLALLSLLGVYLLLGLQVIRWIPPGVAISGEELTARSLKILMNEVGFHRVNLSMMLSGASWACIAAAALFEPGKRRYPFYAGFIGLVYAQALTAGRVGYASWAAVGLFLAFLRWRKMLLLVPAVALAVFVFVPGVSERLAQGFSPDSRDSGPALAESGTVEEDEPDIYTVTAGRNIAWRYVVKKIRESPVIGFGRQAMLRTGVARTLLENYGEEFGHPHNAYLEMLLDNGLVGFLLVIPFYAVVMWYGVSLFLDSRNPVYTAAGGVACALVLALLVAAMGSQTFYPREGSVPMWCAIGLLLRVHVERARGFSWEGKPPADPEEVPFWERGA